ncbi:unnamed protein product [Linum tenue]|uniref:1,3-beta-glucan synthase n=1 Tax=Linum tenue TaxID=586396 RepID=A0AAV0NFU8_9ROSI|nr:unnamed protein product [Linum tenue]
MSANSRGPRPTRGRNPPPHQRPQPEVFNIIPIHDLLTDHPSLRYPEVRAAAAALRAVGDLRKPPFLPWEPHYDLLDWLGLLFGFQRDSVRNQREHLVLHLANSQMRLQPPPSLPDALDPTVLRRFRRKLLTNYTSWCSYIGRRSQLILSGRPSSDDLIRRELLYVGLYLLIWGESGNLRFMPECLCYIYHHMAMELNQFLDEWTDPETGRAFLPSISGECAFLKSVIMPIYRTLKSEVDSSRNGTKPHSAWRNYDDLNEFFWSRRCFKKLRWPLNFSSNFFDTVDKIHRVGKTGFVEQRSFWNLFRSFDKQWVLLILFLQASIIVAWEETKYPWHAIERRAVQVKLLSCFITWSGLRVLQAVLDAGTQYSLVTRETWLLGLRMSLKFVVAVAWTVVFGVFYGMIWRSGSSNEADQRITMFLQAVLVFVIPELLAILLFILPWIRNAIEEWDWSFVYLFTWWFHTRTFVGRGLREGLVDNVKYTVFWILVLASKFVFSYFLQIKPMVAPTKAILKVNIFQYKWHEFFGHSNRVAVVVMWMPVMLIYFTDLQIWYAIFSSFVGATVGLFSHLGEIRNIGQLRLRFQFFASAMQFNLMPEEQLLGPKMNLVKKLRDAIHRLRLRYGFGQPYTKIESSQVEATRFALIWNEIMTAFREEDLISYKELELLELPPNCWNVRVIRWPYDKQVYGQHKAKGDPRADEILHLMKNNEALRVAYVDEVHLGRDEAEYYSVLVKYDQEQQREVEVYRVRLPGPLKLGEGKPENQNHAFIFTRGDAVQTIDMNQDNSFEEALKMRNLLEEFKVHYGIRRPTILGVRENIFTGSVSSLAWFMSAQETSFVTLGQRVLANPLKIRMHYGHPDVFDRFWFMPRGGVSKASRLINISEDIFAGFNCTLRGGNVTHHEYIQVGKGRDVGLNQISMFEAKVASGNGEQILSRDVYRLGHRLDFFRMLSFYYTTVGFFFNTMVVVLTVYSFLWGRLYLALSGIEGYAMETSKNNKAFGVILNQQFFIQIGLFTALPMVVENSLEHGFLPAVWDFLTMQLQLASVFYTFSMGTRAHFFGRTILHGGAKYRATGRGFVVQHKSFAENYRLYSRSHFVKAIELGVILIVYAAHSPMAQDSFVYLAMTLSSWFLVLSWIMAPFVFNPSGFDWLKTVYDFEDFLNWIWYKGGVFTKAEHSWETWWYEEQDHLRTTGLWGKLLEIILDLRYFMFQYGVVYQLNITGGKTSISVYLLSWIYMIAVMGIYVVMMYAQERFAAKEHIKYRLTQLVVISMTVLVLTLLLDFTSFTLLDLVSSMLAFVPTGWGLISIALVLRPFLESTVVWDTVVSLARIYDLLFGVIVMAPVALLSWLPGFQAMQTRILFNEAFSRGLQISRILSGKKTN